MSQLKKQNKNQILTPNNKSEITKHFPFFP